MAQLVLGSASPRRRELLALALPEVRFRVVAPDVDESVLPGERPADYLARVVRAKALDVARLTATDADVGAILCADTTVLVDERIVGKPADDDEGRAMLRDLSARTHEAWTAFVVADRRGTPLEQAIVRTTVTFRAITPAEIEAYVASGQGRDKAGGYGIQGSAAAFVTAIAGSPTNVVGLPLSEVTLALTRLGLR